MCSKRNVNESLKVRDIHEFVKDDAEPETILSGSHACISYAKDLVITCIHLEGTTFVDNKPNLIERP